MRRMLVAALTLLTTATLVTSATVAGATVAGATVAGATKAGAGVSRPDRARQEQFRIISTVTGSRRQSVLATGAFTAGGYLVPGRVVNLNSTDRLVFPNGSFQLARHITRQWLPLPTAACLIRETVRGRYVLGHGTGAYRRLSGSGGFTMRITGVIRRAHGKCGGPLTVFQQIVYADGPVRG